MSADEAVWCSGGGVGTRLLWSWSVSGVVSRRGSDVNLRSGSVHDQRARCATALRFLGEGDCGVRGASPKNSHAEVVAHREIRSSGADAKDLDGSSYRSTAEESIDAARHHAGDHGWERTPPYRTPDKAGTTVIASATQPRHHDGFATESEMHRRREAPRPTIATAVEGYCS